MKKVFVDSNVRAQQVGGLFEPVRRSFSGIGAAIIAALKALPTSQRLMIHAESPTSYSLGSLTGPPETTAFLAAKAVNAAAILSSDLPTGATVRYQWGIETVASGIALDGPTSTHLYSLEDFLNNLFDGGFDPDFEGASEASGIVSSAFGASFAVVVDQPTGLVYVSVAPSVLAEWQGLLQDGVPAVVFKTEEQKWE